MQRTQDKSSYARRRNEAYWGTPIDDNAVYGDLDKSNAQVICRRVLSTVPGMPHIGLRQDRTKQFPTGHQYMDTDLVSQSTSES